jgi:hypothetical protein
MPTPVTNEKISQLANGNPAQTGDLVPIARGSSNFSLTAGSIAALNAGAGLVSPAFTGTPTAPTASPLTNDTQLATTAYADAAVAVEAGRATTAEALLVPKTTTVNGHALSANVIVSASDITTGTLPHAQLPTLLSGDIPNNAANTSGTAGGLSAPITESQITSLVSDLAGKVPTTTTVNGYALSGNIVVSASDITTGTLPHAQLPTLLSGDIPNNAANTSGTAANLSGTPALPSGTTAITQASSDNSTLLATTAYVRSLRAQSTVTFSATPTFTAATFSAFKLTLTGNVTSSTLSGATAGQTLVFEIIQDATAGRTFVWPTNVKGGMDVFNAGGLTNQVATQLFYYDGTNAYALTSGMVI